MAAQIRTAKPQTINIEAFAIDGSHMVTVHEGEANPEARSQDTDLSPDAEYVLLIAAKSEWNIHWTPQTGHSRETGATR